MNARRFPILKCIACALCAGIIGVFLWHVTLHDPQDEPGAVIITLANVQIEIGCENADLVSKATGNDMLEYANGFLEGWHNYSISHSYIVTRDVDPELRVTRKEPSFRELYEEDEEPDPRSMGYYRDGYFAGRAQAEKLLKNLAGHSQSSMRIAGPL